MNKSIAMIEDLTLLLLQIAGGIVFIIIIYILARLFLKKYK